MLSRLNFATLFLWLIKTKITPTTVRIGVTSEIVLTIVDKLLIKTFSTFDP